MNRIWFVFDQTFVGFRADVDLFDAITGADADFDQKETVAGIPREIDMAVNPQRLLSALREGGFKVSRTDLFVLRWLAKRRGLMTIAVRSYFDFAEDFLEAFPRRTRMRQSMDNAVTQGNQTLETLKIERARAAQLAAAPTDEHELSEWSDKQAAVAAAQYWKKAIRHLSQPQFVNLMALKWRKLGRQIETEVALAPVAVDTAPPPTPTETPRRGYQIKRREN
jgi:hypothetical protein